MSSVGLFSRCNAYAQGLSCDVCGYMSERGLSEWMGGSCVWCDRISVCGCVAPVTHLCAVALSSVC